LSADQLITNEQRVEITQSAISHGQSSEAFSKKWAEDTESLSTQFQTQNGQVEKLKKSLLLLERKIAEARTKKDMLKARAQAAKAQEQIQSAVGDLGSKSAMAAFERMED